MTLTDFTSALLAARQQGRAAMQALAEAHLPLVAALVRRFPPGLHEREELYQQGCIGLMKALLRFDPAMGTTFATYAVPVILGEMRQLSRLNAPIHIPRPEMELRRRIRRSYDALSIALGREATVNELASAMRMDASELMLLMEAVPVASSDAPVSDGSPLSDSIADPHDWVSSVELLAVIEGMEDQDRALLRLRCLEGLTQAETARRLGLTQVQVSRREMLLRRRLRAIWYGT